MKKILATFFLIFACGRDPLLPGVDGGTDITADPSTPDASDIDMVPDSGRCAPGYVEVAYEGAQEYCQPVVWSGVPPEPGVNPCGTGTVTWWGGRGVVRCDWSAGWKGGDV
jgi:hypothetical protein